MESAENYTGKRAEKSAKGSSEQVAGKSAKKFAEQSAEKPLKKKGEYPEKSKYFPYERFRTYFKGRILEIGCADGNNTRFLREYYGMDRFYSLELSYQRLSRAASKTDNYMVNASGTNIPFRDSSFDFVYCSEVIEHLLSSADQGLLADEIRRVLKPGGVAIITTPNHYLYRLFCLLTFSRPDQTHYTELTSFAFSQLLSKRFKKVRIEGVFGVLAPLFGISLFRNLHTLLSRHPGLCKALIAVCEK